MLARRLAELEAEGLALQQRPCVVASLFVTPALDQATAAFGNLCTITSCDVAPDQVGTLLRVSWLRVVGVPVGVAMIGRGGQVPNIARVLLPAPFPSTPPPAPHPRLTVRTPVRPNVQCALEWDPQASVLVGQEQSFRVTLRTADGTAAGALGRAVLDAVLSARGSGGVAVEVGEADEQGMCRCRFTAGASFTLSVLVLGAHVAGSPRQVEVATLPPDGVHGTKLVHGGWVYSALPEGKGPNARSEAQDRDPHTLGDGKEVVDVRGADWAGVLAGVITPYSWNTNRIVCCDSSAGTWPAFKSKNSGAQDEANLSWIKWSNGGRTFQFSSANARVLVRSRRM